MKKTIGAMVCIIIVFSLVLIPLANADWAMFQADPSHSGAGTGNSVLNPTLLWEKNDSVGSSPAVVDGIVYVGSFDGYVYALNAASGTQLWKYYIGVSSSIFGVAFPPPGVTSSPAVVGGIVYVGSIDDNVYALNATSGEQLWNCGRW